MYGTKSTLIKVLYERKDALQKQTTTIKDPSLYQPVRFFFEAVDCPSEFGKNLNIQWYNNNRQWIQELTVLLISDKSKLRQYREQNQDATVQRVRDFYGRNRPLFKYIPENINFIGLREITYTHRSIDFECESEKTEIYFEGCYIPDISVTIDPAQELKTLAFNKDLELLPACAYYQSRLRKSKAPARAVKRNFNQSSLWKLPL